MDARKAYELDMEARLKSWSAALDEYISRRPPDESGENGHLTISLMERRQQAIDLLNELKAAGPAASPDLVERVEAGFLDFQDALLAIKPDLDGRRSRSI